MSHIPEERNDHWTQAITTILVQSHNNILIFTIVLLCYMHFFKKFKWTLPTEGLSLENIDARKLEFKNDRFPSRSSLCYVGILIKGWCCHSPLARHMGLVSPVLRFNFHFFNSLLSPIPLRFQTVSFKCQRLRREFLGNYGGAELGAHCLHY